VIIDMMDVLIKAPLCGSIFEPINEVFSKIKPNNVSAQDPKSGSVINIIKPSRRINIETINKPAYM
jgi:hypothetical protein